MPEIVDLFLVVRQGHAASGGLGDQNVAQLTLTDFGVFLADFDKSSELIV